MRMRFFPPSGGLPTLAAAIAFSFFALACGGSGAEPAQPKVEPRAGTMSVRAGDNQTGIVGAAVTILPSVIVRSAAGAPMADVTVTFAVSSGGGSLTGEVQRTGADGIATLGTWILGTKVGQNALTASASGMSSVSFTAQAGPGPATSIAAATGDNQSATARSFVGIAPSVVVRDTYGNAVPSVSVIFSPAAGSGSVTDSVRVTDSNGAATVGSWALGSQIGQQTLNVRLAGASSSITPASIKANAVGYGAVPSNYKDQLIGYLQGWFATPGDATAVNRWYTWGDNLGPRTGNTFFDLYPDVRDYPASELFPTGLGQLMNGQPARLFSSARPAVVDRHLQWVRDHGIDGVELQMNFGHFALGAVFPSRAADEPVFRTWRVQMAQQLKTAAEKYGRTFYINYDVCCQVDSASVVSRIQDHWRTDMVGRAQILQSASYARQSGKPVVGITGLAFSGGQPIPQPEALKLIRWFKDQGFYVVGAAQVNWHTNAALRARWNPTLAELNMLRPWAVGSVAATAQVATQYPFDLNAYKAFTDSAKIERRSTLGVLFIRAPRSGSTTGKERRRSIATADACFGRKRAKSPSLMHTY
jgi:hypothetical protein